MSVSAFTIFIIFNFVSSAKTDTQLTIRYNKKLIDFKTDEFNRFSHCMGSSATTSCSATTRQTRLSDVTSSIDQVRTTTRNDAATGVGIKQCSAWTTLLSGTSATEITCRYTGSHRCDLTITVNSPHNLNTSERKTIVFSFGWDVGAYHYFDIAYHNTDYLRVEKCAKVWSKIVTTTVSRNTGSSTTLLRITVSNATARSDSSITKDNEPNGPTGIMNQAITKDADVVLISQGAPSNKSQGNTTPDVSTLKLTVVVLGVTLGVCIISFVSHCIYKGWQRAAGRISYPLYCPALHDAQRRDSHVYTAPIHLDSVPAGQGSDLHLYDVVHSDEDDDDSAPVNHDQKLQSGSGNTVV